MARRISFGERMGDVKAPALSLKEASEPLRTGIWNTCHEWIFPGETYYYERYRALMEGKRPLLATLFSSLKCADQAASWADCSCAARFQGRSSLTRLMGWSAMRSRT